MARFFRMRWRAAFVLCVVAALALGTVVKRARDRAWAIEEIEKAGGWISYRHQQDSKNSQNTMLEIDGPEWLRKVLGDAFFATIDSVTYSFRTPGSYPLDLQPFRYIPEIEALNLAGSDVADNHFRDMGSDIGKLARLEDLSLGWTSVGDESLIYIGHLRSLRTLDLRYTQVTDTGLKHLENLGCLEELLLDHTAIGDAGLRQLSNLDRLSRLGLSRTRVTGQSLAALPSSLTDIQLSHTKIDDSHLLALDRFSKLREIDLSDTRVTNAIAEQFNSADLTFVNLRWTFVDKEGAIRLKERFPNVHVLVGKRLPDRDIYQIRNLIGSLPDIDRHILTFCRISERRVEVYTGVIRGDLNGGGDIVILEKDGSRWKVVDISGWDS